MITRELKLILSKNQTIEIDRWFVSCAAIYNFGLRKIELNAKNKIYFSCFEFITLLTGHSQKLDIASRTIQEVLKQAHDSWGKCFKKISGKPKLKGHRNKLKSIPFPSPIKRPEKNIITLPTLGKLKYHKQNIPEGKIKQGRIIRKPSGYYLSIVIEGERESIVRKSNNEVGIDPGFKNLLTLSNGQKFEHPREFEARQKRLGQAQRGKNKRLAARIHERIANQKKDRNHKISRKLVEENSFIAFSKDKIQNIAKKFGKSVNSSNHYQLRKMLEYKSSSCDTQYIEVDSKNSTKTCSDCGALSGPTGWVGLKVRYWSCTACGSYHDRDINAAMNTLILGRDSASNDTERYIRNAL